MSCTCNTADSNCEPCAFCTPPGVKCLPNCNPPDPCDEEIDLCCVKYSGEDQDCSEIKKEDSLCELLIKFLKIEFPDEECCRLEMSIDLLNTPIPTTSTTTTSTTSTSTTTTTTKSIVSTTSTTTTTTISVIQFCYSTLGCGFACDCFNTTNVSLYYTCATIEPGCVLYTNPGLTTTTSAGHYSVNSKCYTVSAQGVVTSVSNCVRTLKLCYTTNAIEAYSICNCINQIN